jgi:hypothetical protein
MSNNNDCFEELIKIHTPTKLGGLCIFSQLFENQVNLNLRNACARDSSGRPLLSPVAQIYIFLMIFLMGTSYFKNSFHENVAVPEKLEELGTLKFASVQRLPIETVELKDLIKTLTELLFQFLKHGKGLLKFTRGHRGIAICRFKLPS